MADVIDMIVKSIEELKVDLKADIRQVSEKLDRVTTERCDVHSKRVADLEAAVESGKAVEKQNKWIIGAIIGGSGTAIALITKYIH